MVRPLDLEITTVKLGLEQMFKCSDICLLPHYSFTKITIQIFILLHQAMVSLYQAMF